MKYSIREIIGDSGKNYGVGVYLDSTLLDGLTDNERKQMVKLFVATDLAGKKFIAYDKQSNPVLVSVANTNEKFINKKGKKVQVNKDLESKFTDHPIKQQAVILADELLKTAKQGQPTVAKHEHEWLDNYGKNLWDEFSVYLQEKNNSVWLAEIKIANDANGRKVLYDIVAKKMVEGSGKSAPTSTTNNISQDNSVVNSNSMQNSENNAKELHSDRDSHYLDLAKDPEKNKAELQKTVDEAARESGYCC